MRMLSFWPGSKVRIYIRFERSCNKFHILPALTWPMLLMIVKVILLHAVLTVVYAHNDAAGKQAVKCFIHFPFFIKGGSLVKQVLPVVHINNRVSFFRFMIVLRVVYPNTPRTPKLGY